MSLHNLVLLLGEYAYLGQVSNVSLDELPALTKVTCILEIYLTQDNVSNSDAIWDDSGSGTYMDGSIWKCIGDRNINPGLFNSRRDYSDSGNNDCHILMKSKFILC